ncbi:hypothetical protein CI238_10862 [Colletotrichum incanum]|uniref:Uncharacterized protein n=1 Tax=Colletotrichum incanum TaxID=1573173 RepID=A0A162PJY8_COLIC|nr:hypothetical protein CI238_10862 [Colletotrichum incanum]
MESCQPRIHFRTGEQFCINHNTKFGCDGDAVLRVHGDSQLHQQGFKNKALKKWHPRNVGCIALGRQEQRGGLRLGSRRQRDRRPGFCATDRQDVEQRQMCHSY